MSENVVACFLRLPPEARRTLVEQFALLEAEDASEPDEVNRAHRWLRRASHQGMLDGDFGAAVVRAANLPR